MSKYHKPKITRFDLDALDFMIGTETFNNDEVGQYMRLIVYAWLNDHECEIPSDLSELARIARCTEVSKNVLAKFRSAGDGVVVNDRQLSEWRAAQKRSKLAQKKAVKKWHGSNAAAMPQQCNGNAEAMPISVSDSDSDSISEGKEGGEKAPPPANQETEVGRRPAETVTAPTLTKHPKPPTDGRCRDCPPFKPTPCYKHAVKTSGNGLVPRVRKSNPSPHGNREDGKCKECLDSGRKVVEVPTTGNPHYREAVPCDCEIGQELGAVENSQNKVL